MSFSPGVSIAAFLSVGVLGGGCRAGPPPEDFPPPVPPSGAGAEPGRGGPQEEEGWTDALDGLVFGSAAEPTAFGPGGAGPTGSTARQGDVHGDGRYDSLEALATRAARAMEEDRLEDALKLLDAGILAAGRSREDAWAFRRALADLLLALGREPEAAEAYRGALQSEAARRSPAVWGNLAVALLRRGDLAGAREAAEEALRVDPAYPEAKKTLGLADIEDGRLEEGRARLLDALGSGREIPEAERALAELEEREGDPGAALSRYRRLLGAFERERPRDRHRRWRDLFRPLEVETGEELRRRIERLEASVAGQGR